MSREILTCALFIQLRENYLLSEAELDERAVSHEETEQLTQQRARVHREILIVTVCYRTLHTTY